MVSATLQTSAVGGLDLEARTAFIDLVNRELAAVEGLGARVLDDGSIISGQYTIGAVTGRQFLVYDSLTTPSQAKSIKSAADSAIKQARINGVVPSYFPDVELYAPPGS